MTQDHLHNDKFFDVALIVFWLLIAFSKIYVSNIIYVADYIHLQLFFSLLFWLSGVSIILLSFIRQGVEFNLVFCGLCFFLFIALINYKQITFVFSLLIWYSIARLISLKSFTFCYLTGFLFLLLMIGLTLMLHGQTYYMDGRYGAVASFGFANSNSFPQLLIIAFIALSCGLKWRIMFAVLLFLLLYEDIKTRTFYLILILSPLLAMICRYCLPAMFTKVVFGLLILNLLAVFYHDWQWLAMADKLLSSRLTYSYQLLSELDSLKEYLAGKASPLQRLPMDMSYVVTLFHYGLPGCIFLAYLYMRALKKFIRQRQTDTVALILCFLTYAIVENVLINYLLNPTLFYVFYAIEKLPEKSTKSDTIAGNAINLG